MKMAAIRAGAILVFLSVFPGSERVSGQHPPCYQCEDYKENHSQTTHYQQIRSHCSYPCECDERELNCPSNVSIIRDGCGCCPICAGQLGQSCDGISVCDDRKGLVCHYLYSGATVGICQATTGLPCMVSNKTYSHGETFQTDCRTQCSCQNGTYACSSLCPNENISPRGACTHPRLVEVPDQCCREWMCDSTEAEHPPVCKQQFTSWSTCSAECGLGISQRISNLNQNCILQNETRICQLRPCEIGMLSMEQHARHRHIRRGHECKATQRVRGPVRLRFGPCKSKKRYRPKFCGSCDEKASDGCCTPQLSTTIKVEFICNSIRLHADPTDILLDLIEPGRDLWWPDDLFTSGKQRSTQASSIPFGSIDDEFHRKFIDNWIRHSNDNAMTKKMRYFDTKSKEKYNSEVLSIVTKEDMHLFQNKDKLNKPFLGADVLIYEPGYNEKYYRNNNRNVTDTMIMTTPYKTRESKIQTSAMTIEETIKDSTTSMTTLSNPKKKRKKKAKKAFTSWLEFRDEEYQMDEYEDEDESHSNRKKRSLDGMENNHERNKRYSGSFREGFLEETPEQNEEYEDEDRNDEDEDSDELEDDEDEDEDSYEEKEVEEDTSKKNQSRRRKRRNFPSAKGRRKRDITPQHHNRVDLKRYSHSIPLRFSFKQEKTKRRKERAYSLTDKNATNTNRIERLEEVKDIAKHSQPLEKTKERKTKSRKINETKLGEIKKHNNQVLVQKLDSILTHERQGNSKIERIVSRKNKVIKMQSLQGENNKIFYHSTGSMHKNRIKRRTPRSPWLVGKDNESKDLSRGDHSVSFSVQWIVKCHCSRDCGVDSTTFPSEMNSIGEVILRRIHRTSPP